MSDQEIPDNIVEFRRKPSKGQAPAKKVRAVAPDPDLQINSTNKLEPGDNVVCRIVKYVPGGFNVIIIPQNLAAYLPSNTNHQSGDEIYAVFVKAEKDRLLLSQRAAVNAKNKSASHQQFPNPGDKIICHIVKPETGGFEVFIPKFNWPGFLASDVDHHAGDEVLTTFVCVDKQRMLLSERFSVGKGDLLTRFPSNTDDSDEEP